MKSTDGSERREQRDRWTEELDGVEGRVEAWIALSESEAEVAVGIGVEVVTVDKLEDDKLDTVRNGLSSSCELRHHGIPCHSFASSKNSRLFDNKA